MKKTLALVLVLSLCLSLCACGQSEESRVVEDLIKAIGTISLESESVIIAAEEAYRALTEEAKQEIADSAAILVQARVEYDKLVYQAKEQKIIEDSQLRVDKVIQKIDAIGTVSLESRDAILDARFAYKHLPDDEQERVTNIEKLDEAEAQLTVLRREAQEQAIQTHKSKFKVIVDEVDNVSLYRHKSFPEYCNTRCYIATALAIQNDSAQLVIVYNYTDDDWVFFDTMTIVVDGEKYEITASGVDRQVGWNGVVEQYVETLPVGLSMEDAEIALLTAIANSETTIIRFRGSKGKHDYTVKQADKDVIKDTLALYSAFVD